MPLLSPEDSFFSNHDSEPRKARKSKGETETKRQAKSVSSKSQDLLAAIHQQFQKTKNDQERDPNFLKRIKAGYDQFQAERHDQENHQIFSELVPRLLEYLHPLVTQDFASLNLAINHPQLKECQVLKTPTDLHLTFHVSEERYPILLYSYQLPWNENFSDLDQFSSEKGDRLVHQLETLLNWLDQQAEPPEIPAESELTTLSLQVEQLYAEFLEKDPKYRERIATLHHYELKELMPFFVRDNNKEGAKRVLRLCQVTRTKLPDRWPHDPRDPKPAPPLDTEPQKLLSWLFSYELEKDQKKGLSWHHPGEAKVTVSFGELIDVLENDPHSLTAVVERDEFQLDYESTKIINRHWLSANRDAHQLLVMGQYGHKFTFTDQGELAGIGELPEDKWLDPNTPAADQAKRMTDALKRALRIHELSQRESNVHLWRDEHLLTAQEAFGDPPHPDYFFVLQPDPGKDYVTHVRINFTPAGLEALKNWFIPTLEGKVMLEPILPPPQEFYRITEVELLP